MSYIEENGYFIFGGVKSSDYGVWISGGGTYNAPARRYKEYVVPGRNGTLTIDEGAYEEAEVTYPAFIARNFPANIEAFRNAIMAQNGYVRMTDSYHPDEFYFARYMAGLEVDTLPGGRGGSFELTFKRDPRRFLTSGETASTIGEWGETETASGEIVTLDLEDGKAFKSIVADIDSVQSYNGYDHPWAGGNGKNLIPYPYYQTTRTVNGVTFTDNGDGTITVNGTNTGSSTAEFVMTGGSQNIIIPSGSYLLSGCTGGSSTTYLVQWNPTGGEVINNYGGSTAVNLSADIAMRVSVKVISGASVNNVTIKPMLRLASDTDATWQPYANVCPISGWTGANITRTGKNLIPYPYYQTTRTENGITWTDNGDGTVTANGTATAVSYFFVRRVTQSAVPLPVGDYILTCLTNAGSATTFDAYWYQTDGKSQTTSGTDRGDGQTITINDSSAQFDIVIRIQNGVTVNNLVFKPMLRLAFDTDSTYEPYQGNAYPITFPTSAGTVYGGYVDVVSGTLTVDKAFATLTGASGEDWRAATQSDFVGFYLNNTAAVLSGRKASGDIAVNEFIRINGSGWGSLTAPGQMLYVSNINIRVNNNVIGTTVEELRTWLANNPIEIAYELATPQTYQLTPQEITALVGVNTLWADMGEIAVEYGDDPNVIKNPTLFASKPLIRATFNTANENYVKMPYSDGSPYEFNGITYTTEADGSVRVTGTCGETRSFFSFRAYNDPVHLLPGNYHFECCPSGGSSTKFYASIWHRYNGAQVGTTKWDYGTGGVDFTITETESQYDTMIQIYVQPGVTIDELFTPSLVADTDEVYFYVGNDKITLQNRFAYIDIDSDIQDCYSDYSNANPYVQFQSNDFPVLEPGVTGITLGAGIESIEITPRWFRL